jgi:hypothetical protein
LVGPARPAGRIGTGGSRPTGHPKVEAGRLGGKATIIGGSGRGALRRLNRNRKLPVRGSYRRAKVRAEAIVQDSLDRIVDRAANGPDGRQLLARAQGIGREADLW